MADAEEPSVDAAAPESKEVPEDVPAEEPTADGEDASADAPAEEGGEPAEGEDAPVDGAASGGEDAKVEEDELPFKDLRAELLRVINNDRTEAGLAPVEFDETLSKVADAHCTEMGEAGFIGHLSLNGHAPFHRYFFAASCKDHVLENVYGTNAGDGEVYDTSEPSLQTFSFDGHATMMTSEPPHDQARRHALGAAHTHVGIGLYLDKKRFRMVEVFVDRYVELLGDTAGGPGPAPGFDLTTDETFLYAKCTKPGFGVLACVVFYEPPPAPLTAEEANGITAYDDFSPERVAVVWPWEMERLADGVVHIPIFFNAVQRGLYYTQVLVREDVDSIPYGGPSEDLDITSPDVVPATGIVLQYDAPDGGVGWGVSAALAHEADVDADGLDMIVAGIEPFSEVVLCSGSEPTLLGFKRQGVLTRGADDPIVVCVANAPGLPPVCDVCVISSDGAEDSMRAPDGYDLIGPNMASVFAESAALKAAMAPPPPPETDGGEGEGGEEVEEVVPPVAADAPLTFNPPNVFLAVKRQSEEAPEGTDGPVSPARSMRSGEPLLLDVAITLQLPDAEAPTLPSGYEHSLTPVQVQAGDVSLTAKVLLVWTTEPEAVADVLAAAETAKAEEEAAAAGAAAEEEERAKLEDVVGEDDGGELQEAVEDVEAIAKRKLAERQKLTMLLADAQAEKEELAGKNTELQRMLAAYFLMRQVEDEKAAERVGGAGAPPAAGAGAPRPLIDAEPKYMEVLQEVVAEKQRLGQTLARCDAQAMELQVRLDDKEARAKEIHQSFVEFKREIAKAAENSRTGKPIPRRIITQFEATELAKDQEVERVRLKNIHLRAQLRKLESQIKEKEQLAEGLHLIDFEQLKIENQTLNEKIEDRNEDLHKERKKTTQTVQVLTHVKEKLQFVQAEVEVLKLELASVEAQVSAQRDALSRAKHKRDAARTENDRLRASQGFVTNDKLVIDFERRKKSIKGLENQLAELKDRYMFLSAQTQSRTRTMRATAK